ncbi:hypothetical protein ACFVHW_33995 [Streptomyces sp. NPDC127110]|uniref:hypothetical protein n=1 Tax=Streptomyces sp. NPDC127110 TaxID=3345362 RepID=UPI00362EC90A
MVAAVDQEVGGVLHGAEFPGEGEGAVGQGDGPSPVGAGGREAGEGVQGQRGAPAVAEAPEPVGGRVEGPLGPVGVALAEGRVPGHVPGGRARPRVGAVVLGGDERERVPGVPGVRPAGLAGGPHHPEEGDHRVAAGAVSRPGRGQCFQGRRAVELPERPARRRGGGEQDAGGVLLSELLPPTGRPGAASASSSSAYGAAAADAPRIHSDVEAAAISSRAVRVSWAPAAQRSAARRLSCSVARRGSQCSCAAPTP